MQITLSQDEIRKIIFEHLKTIGYSWTKNTKNPVYTYEEMDGETIFCFNLNLDALTKKNQG
jgi:hypothetical protein